MDHNVPGIEVTHLVSPLLYFYGTFFSPWVSFVTLHQIIWKKQALLMTYFYYTYAHAFMTCGIGSLLFVMTLWFSKNSNILKFDDMIFFIKYYTSLANVFTIFLTLVATF